MRKFFVTLLNSSRPAVVDLQDAPDILAMGSWRMTEAGYVQHARHRGGRNTRVAMHRLLMGPMAACQVVDHINHDKLDNRKCNLRVVSRAANTWNRLARTAGPSGCRGITRPAESHLWHVQFWKDRRRYRLGYYRSLLEAKAVATLAMALLYGRCAQFFDEPLLGRDFDDVCARAAGVLAFLPERAQRRLMTRLAGAVHEDSVGLFQRLAGAS
jgi:hypothetical protein